MTRRGLFGALVALVVAPWRKLARPHAGEMTAAQAARLKVMWDAAYSGDNLGKVVVLSDEEICATFHVPAWRPLCSVPPIYAAGLEAVRKLEIRASVEVGSP